MSIHPPYYKGNLKILGSMFKNYRVEKGYSIRGISRSEKLAHSVISDIETGRIYPNIETLANLYKQIGIDLLIAYDVLTHYKEHIDLFFEAVYFSDANSIEDSYQKLNANKIQLTNSLLIIDYFLAEETYQVTVLKNLEGNLLNIIERFMPYLSDEQKQKYYLIKGIILFNTHDFNQAIEVFEGNLVYSYSQKLEAVTLSYLTKINERIHNIHKAIHYGNTASKKHAEQACMERKLETDILIIKNLIEVKRFQESDLMLKNLSAYLEDEEGIEEIVVELTYLRAYWLMRQNLYLQALELIDIDKGTGRYHHIFVAVLLVKVGRFEEAILLMEKAQDDPRYQNDTRLKSINCLHLQHLTQCYDDQFEPMLMKLLDEPLHLPDYNVYRELHLIGIHYFEFTGDYKKALLLAKKHLIRSTIL